jgi:hypothetical protein
MERCPRNSAYNLNAFLRKRLWILMEQEMHLLEDSSAACFKAKAQLIAARMETHLPPR